MRHFVVWAALLAGLGGALNVVPGQAADAETIEKLVKQLGSGRFNEREKAHKKLDEIGLPALDALKKAAESGDPETKRRAGELVSKLEKQVQDKKILAPTKLKLSFKDAPLKDALADLSKKTGYLFTLVDPENKLKDRKVTVEIGEISFWEAFDQFCAKVGLIEADANEVNPGVDVQPPFGGPGGIQIQPGGGIQIQPGVIIRPNVKIQPLPGKVVPAPQPAPKPAEKAPAIEKLQQRGALQTDEAPAVPARKAQQGRAQVGKPAVAPAAQPVQIRRRPPIRQLPPQQGTQPNQILLKDGTAKTEPTSYAGAVRVRTTPNIQQFGPVGDKGMVVGLKVSPEPKIRWQNLVNVRIDKAIDDQGQSLMPAMVNTVADPLGQFGGVRQIGGGRVIIIGNGGFGGIPVQGWGGQGFGLHQFVPVRLTKGEKASKSLKELTGSITAQVLAEAEVHITADNILKAAGKTFKGKEGGFLKIVGVDEKNGHVILKFEFDPPRDVVPAGQGGGNFPVGVPFNGGGIQILPALPVVPLPAPAPALPQAKGAFQVKAAPPVQVQVAPAQIQVQIQQIQIGGGGIAIGPGFIGNGNGVGLELLDENGKVIPLVGQGSEGQIGAAGVFQAIHHMTFRLEKEQKAARLVFKGSRSVSVEIPFTLKDVKLP